MRKPYPPDLPDDELDAMARREGASATWGVGPLREEQSRRSTDRQTAELIRLTQQLRDLTDRIRFLTIVAVALGVASLIVAVIAITRTGG